MKRWKNWVTWTRGAHCGEVEVFRWLHERRGGGGAGSIRRTVEKIGVLNVPLKSEESVPAGAALAFVRK